MHIYVQLYVQYNLQYNLCNLTFTCIYSIPILEITIQSLII